MQIDIYLLRYHENSSIPTPAYIQLPRYMDVRHKSWAHSNMQQSHFHIWKPKEHKWSLV